MSDVIDHVEIRVSDLPASRRLYEAALAELGFDVLSEGEFEGDRVLQAAYKVSLTA
jgi:catechol 2,3-dioxygenase-like lactoylglutathione lyase family enzyme